MRLPQVGLILVLIVLAGCAGLRRELDLLLEPQPVSTFAKFLKLAEAGDAKSQNLIGFMLYFGEGIPQDRSTAHRWFHRASDQGDANAQLNVAVMHYLGSGVVKDLDDAERFFFVAKKTRSLTPDRSSKLEAPSTLAELVGRAAMRPQNSESLGESTYAMFCAGCHGLNGIAAYVGSPSFALAERV